MELYLGTNLRQLRRDRDMTQEELAEVLNVSVQSVSRWENQTCYPDVELIPVIASFFQVPVDRLLGVDQAVVKQRVAEFLDQFQTAISVGDIQACIEIARKGVAEFPGSFVLLNKLMYALFASGSDDADIPDWEENRKRFDGEITALGERIMKHCPDQQICLEATVRLAFHHCEMGRKAQGRAIYETLPSMEYSKELQIRWGLEEDERLPAARELIRQGRSALGAGLYDMIQFRLLSDADLIQVYEKLFALDRLIHDKDHPQNGQLLCGQAQVYARLGMAEQSLNALDAAAEAVRAFDARPAQWSDESLLMGERTHRRTDYETADSRPLRQVMAETWMQDTDFDSIRHTPEFADIIRKLQEN